MSYPIYSAVVESDTLPVFFSTYGGTNGESITLTGLAVTDIEIYKDGSITQRSSDAGISLIDTDGTDIDGVTGIHGFTIDLSDNTDAGFYAVDSWYHVVVSSVTVDSQTVSFIACAFRIVSATRGTAGTALDAVPTAAQNASTLLASTADGVAVSTILTHMLSLGVGGKFTYDADTGVLERFAQDGTTSLGQITLTATGGTPV